MEVESLFIPAANPLVTGYVEGKSEVYRHFHYHYQNPQEYLHRIKDLSERTFMREELADHISVFMNPFPSSEKVAGSLKKLRQNNSVVVIGGQQAGILTGPLYTIHKIVSIITLAVKKEKELGVPVVPVFWIAGEDHDYPEVNHVYIPNNWQMKKCLYPEKIFDRRMVSKFLINKDVCLNWTKSVIGKLGETEYTNELLELIEEAVSRSESFVDYFAYLIMSLFKEHGLLIVDSGNPHFRQLQKAIFLQQIDRAAEIQHSVRMQQEKIYSQGYKKSINISENSAHLFFYDEKSHDRILLTFDEDKKIFFGKNRNVSFTVEEMKLIAMDHPEQLSNNVVTRPVTQELLFPVLAFIAGPGEIAYWAELKQVFERFQMKMPIIVPRLNITFLEREIESDLLDTHIELHQVLQKGVSDAKEAFLNEIKDQEFTTLFAKTREQIQNHYRLIAGKLSKEYSGLLPLLNKNETILMRQIDFMEEKIDNALRLKHAHRLKKFERIENSLRPFGNLQERIWNVIYFLNKYGPDLVDELCRLNYKFDGNHNIVRL